MLNSLFHRNACLGLVALLLTGAASKAARSEPAASEPPAVGVVEAVRRPVTDIYEFMGRVQATDRVDLLARVNGFLEQQLFIEGAEVKNGDLLYRLEQPPYQADLEAKQAAVAQAEAQLANADIQLRRAKDLLRGPAGTQARYDDALTAKLSAAAQLRSAQAAERQSKINLGYTEIRAPIAGRIGRGSVTIGNVVGPRGPCDDVPARGDRQAETGTWLYADGSLGAASLHPGAASDRRTELITISRGIQIRNEHLIVITTAAKGTSHDPVRACKSPRDRAGRQ